MLFEKYPDVMNVQQVQDALGVGRNSAYNLLKQGKIKNFHVGRIIKVPKKHLIDYVLNGN